MRETKKIKVSCVASDFEFFSLVYTNTNIRPNLAAINESDTISEDVSFDDLCSD